MHPAAKVIAPNVGDIDRFECFSPIPRPSPRPRRRPTKTSTLEADHPPSVQKGVALSDANISQLSEGKTTQLLHTLGPKHLADLFPEDPDRVTPCTTR